MKMMDQNTFNDLQQIQNCFASLAAKMLFDHRYYFKIHSRSLIWFLWETKNRMLDLSRFNLVFPSPPYPFHPLDLHTVDLCRIHSQSLIWDQVCVLWKTKFGISSFMMLNFMFPPSAFSFLSALFLSALLISIGFMLNYWSEIKLADYEKQKSGSLLSWC